MARRTVQLTLFTATVIAVVLMVTAHWLVGFLVGSAYRDAVNIARVLLVASVFLSMNSTLTALLKAVGRPLQAGLGASLALLVTVAGLILLVPPYGIMGAAVVSLAAYAVSATFMLQRAARELELPVGALLFPRGSRGSRFLPNEEFALAEGSPAHDLRRRWRLRKGSKS
jgi:O-antigen/teichoic acid export membrane protein